MELEYRYSESTVRPNTLEICGDTVYLRKDLTQIAKQDEQGNSVTYWTYQEAALTTEQFNQNANAILVLGQKSGDENQMAVMEAIADLYDVIATMMM